MPIPRPKRALKTISPPTSREKVAMTSNSATGSKSTPNRLVKREFVFRETHVMYYEAKSKAAEYTKSHEKTGSTLRAAPIFFKMFFIPAQILPADYRYRYLGTRYLYKPPSVRGTCMFGKLYWSCYQNVPFRVKKGTSSTSQRVSGRICHINVLYCLESK